VCYSLVGRCVLQFGREVCVTVWQRAVCYSLAERCVLPFGREVCVKVWQRAVCYRLVGRCADQAMSAERQMRVRCSVGAA
jgi:hypothetical protein